MYLDFHGMAVRAGEEQLGQLKCWGSSSDSSVHASWREGPRASRERGEGQFHMNSGWFNPVPVTSIFAWVWLR